MNIAVIFAGGKGTRMKSKGLPKQFLKVHGKPIIIHTLEIFQRNNNIDKIVVACVSDWLDYCKEIIEDYKITKVAGVVPGGSNGQESIYNGLVKAKKVAGRKEKDAVVLIHDGVRPLINDDLIDSCIETTERYGSAITCVPCKETVVFSDNKEVIDDVITDRDKLLIARAPQCFFLKDILETHEQARLDGVLNATDSCTLMKNYGHDIHTVIGKSENIKITTPDDYYIFKALLEAKENSEIFGL